MTRPTPFSESALMSSTESESSHYTILAPAVHSLPIVGDSRRFPVNRIFCVGRNYAEHAREMGHDPNREPPFFFMKPASAIVADGGDFPYPPLSNDVQHEIEMVVALGKGGANIASASALDHVFGYAVGLDMTPRDLGYEPVDGHGLDRAGHAAGGTRKKKARWNQPSGAERRSSRTTASAADLFHALADRGDLAVLPEVDVEQRDSARGAGHAISPCRSRLVAVLDIVSRAANRLLDFGPAHARRDQALLTLQDGGAARGLGRNRTEREARGQQDTGGKWSEFELHDVSFQCEWQVQRARCARRHTCQAMLRRP